MILCHYGCGQIAKKQNKSGNWMCEDYSSKCPAIKLKNSEGGKKSYSSGERVLQKQWYANLSDETKNSMAWSRGKYSADFSFDGKGSHKKVLIQEKGHFCENCNNSEWMGQPISLELEHCDGNNRNNNRENLKLLCPNCHAQTKFYRGRNINSGKLKVTDEQILEELKKGLTNRQILINVGLTPKGGNYDRVNKLRFNAPLAQLEEASDLSSV